MQNTCITNLFFPYNYSCCKQTLKPEFFFKFRQDFKIAILDTCLFFIIIHMCIQGLGHFSSLPPPPPLPPTPSIPSRNYFALIYNFVVERV
jgi:hypothetical protein